MSLPERLDRYEGADRLMRDDLRHYCAKLVRIGTKKPGEVVPFIWNKAQEELHNRLERQRDSRGLVRALVLKARRLGISTYVGARFYHRTSLWRGHHSFILTHEDKATQALFDMVRRMHENMPSDYRHALMAANENELDFANMESGYRVGTAKNVSGLGRGGTLQLFHGSEAAFWAQASKHLGRRAAGRSRWCRAPKRSSRAPANGVGGEFYEQWGNAEKGLSDFIPIFLPWYIDPDNARALPSDYEPSLEEEEYQRLYKLTPEQLCWVHFENINLGGEPGKLCPTFRQENPATAPEAFQTTGTDSFIPNEAILRARRFKAPDQSRLPRVLGIDSARSTGDAGDDTRIVDRQGRKAGTIDVRLRTDDETKIAFEVSKILRDHPDIRRAFFDVTGGYGAGAYDICRANGFEQRVRAINFGSGCPEREPVRQPPRGNVAPHQGMAARSGRRADPGQ